MRYLQRMREFLNQAFIRLEAGFSIKTSSTKTATHTALSSHEAMTTVTNDTTPSTNATVTLSGFETPVTPALTRILISGMILVKMRVVAVAVGLSGGRWHRNCNPSPNSDPNLRDDSRKDARRRSRSRSVRRSMAS
jgi:hypothetical protein